MITMSWLTTQCERISQDWLWPLQLNIPIPWLSLCSNNDTNIQHFSIVLSFKSSICTLNKYKTLNLNLFRLQKYHLILQIIFTKRLVKYSNKINSLTVWIIITPQERSDYLGDDAFYLFRCSFGKRQNKMSGQQRAVNSYPGLGT